jgi:nucleoside 2-deoxyribosyltransferase
MKTFIAYRSKEEDPKTVQPLITSIRDSLQARDIEADSMFFHEAEIINKALTNQQILELAFSMINNIDFLFVIQTSDNKSEGMLMEMGYCLAKEIPIILASKEMVRQTYLPEIAEQSFRWDTVENLRKGIASLELAKF